MPKGVLFLCLGGKYMNIEKIVESGLLKKLTGGELKVILMLINYMEKDNICRVGADFIANEIGVTVSTVRATLRKLCNTTVKGNPILYKVGDYYSFTKIEVKESKHDYNIASVVGLFTRKYEEVYGIKLKPNYAKEVMILHNLKVTERYSWEQVTTIINVGVTEYAARWKTDRFPLPSLSTLFGWMAPLCLELHESSKPKEYDDSCNNNYKYF